MIWYQQQNEQVIFQNTIHWWIQWILPPKTCHNLIRLLNSPPPTTPSPQSGTRACAARVAALMTSSPAMSQEWCATLSASVWKLPWVFTWEKTLLRDHCAENNPLIRPAISWGVVFSIGGGTLKKFSSFLGHFNYSKKTFDSVESTLAWVLGLNWWISFEMWEFSRGEQSMHLNLVGYGHGSW